MWVVEADCTVGLNGPHTLNLACTVLVCAVELTVGLRVYGGLYGRDGQISNVQLLEILYITQYNLGVFDDSELIANIYFALNPLVNEKITSTFMCSS